MRERQSRFETPNVPIQMSFQKSQIEKKRREDFKRKDDDIFYALLNSLFR